MATLDLEPNTQSPAAIMASWWRPRCTSEEQFEKERAAAKRSIESNRDKAN
jgi:hypothetical protein